MTSIPAESLASARAWVRNELQIRHLPSLPDDIEEDLFLEGRTAWTFRYADLVVEPLTDIWRLQFTVLATLKKEFRSYLERVRYAYQATLLLDQKDDNVIALTIEATGSSTP